MLVHMSETFRSRQPLEGCENERHAGTTACRWHARALRSLCGPSWASLRETRFGCSKQAIVAQRFAARWDHTGGSFIDSCAAWQGVNRRVVHWRNCLAIPTSSSVQDLHAVQASADRGNP